MTIQRPLTCLALCLVPPAKTDAFFCILLGREQKGGNHKAPREGGVEGGATYL